MLNKFYVCLTDGNGKTYYWNGTATPNSFGSFVGGKPYDSELSAMIAVYGSKKFTGKVTKEFAAAIGAACNKFVTVEVSISMVTLSKVHGATLSNRNFPI